jgi:hypothetical protein
VELVEHDAAEPGEEIRGVRRGDEERELLGRGHQDLGRAPLLPLAARRRRVARARLDPDGQFHFGDRDLDIARHVHGERLQGRDIERVQRAGIALGQRHEARQEARERLAPARGRDEERRTALPRLVHERELVRARAPAPRREPGAKARRQQIGFVASGHGGHVAPSRAARTEAPPQDAEGGGRYWNSQVSVSALPSRRR